jgi:hypothetical protein
LSVTSVPQVLHTFIATLLLVPLALLIEPPPVPPTAIVPGPAVAVAVAVDVPPAEEQLHRRPTEAPVAVVFTPPHVGQIIKVAMSTSSSRRRLEPPAVGTRWPGRQRTCNSRHPFARSREKHVRRARRGSLRTQQIGHAQRRDGWSPNQSGAPSDWSRPEPRR